MENLDIFTKIGQNMWKICEKAKICEMDRKMGKICEKYFSHIHIKIRALVIIDTIH